MANSVDPDETPRSAASHLGLNCLLRPVCPNTYGKYGNLNRILCKNTTIIIYYNKTTKWENREERMLTDEKESSKSFDDCLQCKHQMHYRLLQHNLQAGDN